MVEHEMVTIRLPRVLVHAGVEICVKAPSGSGCVFAKQEEQSTGDRLYLLMYPIVAGKTSGGLKPDWKTPKIPKMKKGWLTWDERRGWARWDERPEYSLDCKWHSWKPFCGVCPVRDEVFDILNLPCCDGFNERECIWQVG